MRYVSNNEERRFRSRPRVEDDEVPEMFWMSPEDVRTFEDACRLAETRGSRPIYEPNATWAKLRNGAWGVRGTGPAPRPGTTIMVRRKDGGVSGATIGRVLASDGNSWLATIEESGDNASAGRSTGRSAGRSGGRRSRRDDDRPYLCEECGDYVQPGTSCWETGEVH